MESCIESLPVPAAQFPLQQFTLKSSVYVSQTLTSTLLPLRTHRSSQNHTSSSIAPDGDIITTAAQVWAIARTTHAAMFHGRTASLEVNLIFEDMTLLRLALISLMNL